MANRNFAPIQALNKGVKLLAGSFAPNGLLPVDPSSIKGIGFSVERTGVGINTVTLDDSYVGLLSAEVTLQLGTADDKYVQVGSADVVSGKTVEIVTRDKSATDAYETTTVATVADTGALQVDTATFPATASAAQGDYFVVTAVDGTKYAVWLDIDAAGIAPTGAAYVAANVKIKAPIITGGSAADNATAAFTAIGSQMVGITVQDDTAGKLTFTQDFLGNPADIVRHNANDSGNGSFVIATPTAAAASSLQNTYFLINSAGDFVSYYVWMNVNGEGVDPAIAGLTGVMVAIDVGAADTAVASAIAAELDALDDFGATALAEVVTVVNAAYGATTDAADGTEATGFTIQVTQHGSSITQDIAADASNRINFVLLLSNSTV